MSDLTTTIAPKSDRLNADDLIGVPSKTIKITNVSVVAGDQPVSLGFEGDNGKPWYPCKSMRRVLVQVWGGDGNKYVGRRLTLHRDSTVRFGGLEVGGIRISHMSDIAEPITMALTATRAQRKPYTVHPLTTFSKPPVPNPEIDAAIANARLTTNLGELESIAASASKLKGWTAEKRKEMAELVKEKRELLKQQDRQPGE